MKSMISVMPKAAIKRNIVGGIKVLDRRAGIVGNKKGRSIRWKNEVPSRIDEIKKGYSIDRFERLKEDLGVNQEKLADVANISLTTIFRRKVSLGRLTSDESEKIYRLEKLYATALEVLENKENVKAWFNTSQIVFENKTPLEYADTLPGSEEVERVLRRIERGIVL